MQRLIGCFIVTIEFWIDNIPKEQRSWGQHGAHLGPVGPRLAPCRPHEPCHQSLLETTPKTVNLSSMTTFNGAKPHLRRNTSGMRQLADVIMTVAAAPIWPQAFSNLHTDSSMTTVSHESCYLLHILHCNHLTNYVRGRSGSQRPVAFFVIHLLRAITPSQSNYIAHFVSVSVYKHHSVYGLINLVDNDR